MTIKLDDVLFYNFNLNWVKCVHFCYWVCGHLNPGKLLPSPEEAVLFQNVLSSWCPSVQLLAIYIAEL